MATNGNGKQSGRLKYSTTEEIVKAAISFMAAKQISMSPDNYQLWYEYFRGAKRDLAQEIDRLVANNASFDKETNRRLYMKFFRMTDEESDYQKLLADIKSLQETAGTASALLDSIESNLANSTTETKSYDASLGRGLEKSASAKDPGIIRDIIDVLAGETKKMMDSHTKTRTDLNDAAEKITHLKDELSRAEEVARMDALTGLFNRRAFDEKMVEEMSRVDRYAEPGSLALIDIDNFKRFNDVFGHAIGDRALKMLAKLIRRVCRPNDFPARFGGEEFAIIYAGTKMELAAKLAEQLREEIHSTEFLVQDKPEELTVSIGVCGFTKGRGIQGAVDIADRALYLAKADGKNRVKTEKDLDSPKDN